MKLSYRDKVIFICVIVIVILIAGFFLFIKPKYQEMNVAYANLEAKQTEKEEVQAKIDTLPGLVENLKTIAKDIEETQEFFLADQEPYLNEQFVMEMLEGCGVTVESMSTTYTQGNNIVEYMVYPKNVHSYDLLIQADIYNELPEEVYNHYNEIAYPDGQSIVIGVTNVTIGYKDTFALNNVFDFIDTVAEDERTMTVLNLSTEERPQDGTRHAEYESVFTPSAQYRKGYGRD